MRALPEGYVDAVSSLVGLEITEAQKPGVERFLGIAAEMAATLDTVPLDDAALIQATVFALADGEDGS